MAQTTMQKSKNLSSALMLSLRSTDLKSNKVSEEGNSVKEILITPARAKELLSKNTNNRRVKPEKVAKYAAAMSAGKWKRGTFEFIKITKSGTIIDGQHRLLAVIQSGVSVWLQFAYNVSEEVFDVLDTGSVRNATDTFKVAGIKNGNSIPSIIQEFFQLSNNRPNKSLSNTELLEWYYQNEPYWQHISNKALVWYGAFAKILRPSTIGGHYAYFYQINHTDAFDFMNQVATGSNISNEIVTQLRSRLLQDRMSLKKMPMSVKSALIIKAWNVFRGKKSAKLLKFDPEVEKFPVAI